jgi:FdhE protein
MTSDTWLEAHAYLQPVANLAAAVERAASSIDVPTCRIPDWENYRADYLAGVPLLTSTAVTVDLEPGERVAEALLAKLASAAAPDSEWLAPTPGLLHYLGWIAMARYLAPVVSAFADWRDEDKWLRRYCPTCGSLPAMAQLVGADPGRKRLLSCGCCATRWQFKRTCCPFCDTQSDRLESVIVEGESGLRIDHCRACGGYIKTYDGQGEEALLLADWSSLHLDVIAHDRGLKRMAVSLYEFDPARNP